MAAISGEALQRSASVWLRGLPGWGDAGGPRAFELDDGATPSEDDIVEMATDYRGVSIGILPGKKATKGLLIGIYNGFT